MPPSYVFVIDISNSAIQNGLFTSVIESIKDIISNDVFINLSRTRVIDLIILGWNNYI